MVTYRKDILEFNLLLKKLNEFKLFFLRHQLLQHILFWLFSAISLFFLIVIFEHFFFLVPSTKYVLLVGFAFIFIPTFSFIIWLRIKRKIFPTISLSDSRSANLISTHFTDIDDRFLNTLNLASKENHDFFSDDLLMVGVVERSTFLQRYSFREAINTQFTRKLLIFFALFTLVLSSFILFKSKDIGESINRLMHPSVYYSPPAPFEFNLLNSDLLIKSGNDLELVLQLEGSSFPSQVFILLNGQRLNMTRDSAAHFSYQFFNVVSGFSFQFEGSGFYSGTHSVKVLAVPIFARLNAVFTVPLYTGDSSFVLTSLSDVQVPEGTNVEWIMNTLNADTLYSCVNSLKSVHVLLENKLNYTTVLKSSGIYEFSLSNAYFSRQNKFEFEITVIADRYPQIQVLSYVDSSSIFSHFFYGRIEDDYGFSKLMFKYREIGGKWSFVNLPINNNMVSQDIYYSYDFSVLKDISSVEYAFVVWDNDRVNGVKSASTPIYSFHKPNERELAEIQNTTSAAMQKESSHAQNLMEDIKQSIKDLYKSNSTENLSDWDKKQKLKEIQKQKQKLEKLLSEIQKKMKDKAELEKFLEQSDDILKKQEELQKLFDKIFDEELKKLFEELKNLEKKFDDKKFDNLQQQLDNKLEDLQKELDRNLELLKRYEVERDLEQTANKFEKLAEEQKMAIDSINHFKKDTAAQNEAINKLQEKTSQAHEDYKELLEKNEDLKEPMKLDEFDKEFNSIDSSFQKQKENVQNKRKLKNEMQKNGEQMQDLSQKLSNMIKEGQQMQLELSIEELRQILDNVVEFSFKQERIMNKFKNISLDNPKFIEYLQEQKQLERDFKIIQDSIYSISEQIPQIASLVKEDIQKVRKFSTEAVKYFEARRINAGTSAQQFVMTSANNLALFLSESLESLKDMQKNASNGKGGEKKSGEKKPGFMQMQNQQQSLKEQMQKMIDDLKSGKLKKDGKGFSKRLAEILAQQELMQQLLDEMGLKGNLSPDAQKMLQEVKDLLNKNEFDIVNKNITPELLNRQQQILSRLLKAEKSENEREKEEKRESKTATSKNKSNVKFDWDKFNKSLFKENIKENPLNLQPFYKNLYEKYKQNNKQ